MGNESGSKVNRRDFLTLTGAVTSLAVLNQVAGCGSEPGAAVEEEATASSEGAGPPEGETAPVGLTAEGIVLLPELMWYGNKSAELHMPEDWQVEVREMRGAKRPGMTHEQMVAAIREPIGTQPLRELAKGRKKAVIVFDDMTRPTRVDLIAPILVEELLAGGMPEDKISFVCALGTHGALTQHELRKKVGVDILERFRVYNHNCYENCIEVGTTTRGTHLGINREVMAADLKIGIGCVTAHANTGFSGGGKIILPGVAHMESIAHYHMAVPATDRTSVGLGRFDRNVMRFDIEEAAKMVGLDFKVDVVVNERGAATAMFAGDFLQSHQRAVEEAKEIYALDRTESNRDLVIVNAFAKPNEMLIAYLVGIETLLPRLEGTIVILANAPEGQVVHYLLGRFGEDYGGLKYPTTRVYDEWKLVIQAPHFDKTFGDWFANPDAITWTRDWEGTLEVLRPLHGPGSKVAVVPNATMTYYPG
jgi:nickel-dependent lactate racemase